jgi:hypothetical protein
MNRAFGPESSPCGIEVMIKRQIQYLRRVRDLLLPRLFAWPPPPAPTARPQTSLGQRPGNAPVNASQTQQGLNARLIPAPCAIQVIKTNRVPKGRKQTRIRLRHACPLGLSRFVFTPTVKSVGYRLSSCWDEGLDGHPYECRNHKNRHKEDEGEIEQQVRRVKKRATLRTGVAF